MLFMKKQPTMTLEPIADIQKTKNVFFIYAIFSLLACFFCIFTLILYPFSEILFPEEISDFSELSTLEEDAYVKINVKALYYSGFDNASKNKTIGNYYYFFSDKNCTFFLLNPGKTKTPPAELKNTTIYGKVVYDRDLITNLTASLAKQVGFTSDGLSIITSKYMVCETGYTQKEIFTILVLLILFAIISLISCIYNFIKCFRFTFRIL